MQTLTGSALLLLCLTAPALAAADEDRLAWRKVNKDGSWTRAAEDAVQRVDLPSLEPADVSRFCPRYAAATPAERVQFWSGLLSIMARPESNHDPKTTYVEPDIRDSAGQHVVSRGLLQISMESANQKAYACGIVRAEDLHDPAVNLRCGARILAYWVRRDGRIASESRPARGGARYWSVLRGWRPHLPEITRFTRSLPACSAAQ